VIRKKHLNFSLILLSLLLFSLAGAEEKAEMADLLSKRMEIAHDAGFEGRHFSNRTLLP
jgi:hypothetical protein